MITPRQRFTKVYETLTPEKRQATDQPRRCNGLPASQAQRRIYIYIYTLWASATSTTKAHKRGLPGSKYRPIPEAPAPPAPALRLAPRARRLATRTRHPRCHDQEPITTWEPASYAKTQRKITAVLHDRRAPPCYKTDISKM